MKKIIMSLIMVVGLVFGMDYPLLVTGMSDNERNVIKSLEKYNIIEETKMMTKKEILDYIMGEKLTNEKYKSISQSLKDEAKIINDIYNRNKIGKEYVKLMLKAFNMTKNGVKNSDLYLCWLDARCDRDLRAYNDDRVAELYRERINKNIGEKLGFISPISQMDYINTILEKHIVLVKGYVQYKVNN